MLRASAIYFQMCHICTNHFHLVMFAYTSTLLLCFITWLGDIMDTLSLLNYLMFYHYSFHRRIIHFFAFRTASQSCLIHFTSINMLNIIKFLLILCLQYQKAKWGKTMLSKTDFEVFIKAFLAIILEAVLKNQRAIFTVLHY